MPEQTQYHAIRKKCLLPLLLSFLTILLITVSVVLNSTLLSYLAIGSALAIAVLLFLLSNDIAKENKRTIKNLETLTYEQKRIRKLLPALVPIFDLLAEEDAAIVAVTGEKRHPVQFSASSADPVDQIQQFVSTFSRPDDSSIKKIRMLTAVEQSAENIREMELRLPFVEEILKRVIAHTEQAAMVLIERFSSISEQTDKSDKDAKNAIAALGSGGDNESGLEFLIKKSHESIIGRTEVINDFLRLNRENADRVRKISELVTKSEELISGIEDITERSKLIAFNMAVESAKIGDKGLGFKVIVNELQRLNDQTTHFARDIMEIVKSFRSYNQEMLEHWLVKSESLTEQVRTDSNQAEVAVTALKRSYDLSGTLFRSLSDSAISVNRSMSDILESLQFQDITRQQIEGAVSFLVDINTAISSLRKQYEELGYDLGNTPAILGAIRSRHEAQLKVSKDHDIFDLIERRYK